MCGRNKYIGQLCQQYRKYQLKVNQDVIAKELGLSRASISHFERGRRFNERILDWYISNGAPIEKDDIYG